MYRWNSAAEQRDVVLDRRKTRFRTGLERLCQLIHQIHARRGSSPSTISVACIEDPGHSELGQWLADAFLPCSAGRQASVCKTPGSFGWCADIGLPCITAEFSPISADEATEKYCRQ